jgi:excisionase family DNA binding protein
MQQKATTNNNNNPVLTQAQIEVVRAEVQNCLYYSVTCTNTCGAARLLCVEPGTIRSYIKNGKLPASKIGKDYSILLSDINDLLKRTAVVVRMDKRFKRKAI